MKEYYDEGDAIRGQRIACEFRKMTSATIKYGSSRHKQQARTLDHALCVIVKPIKKR